MIDLATDLIGEIVEIWEYNSGWRNEGGGWRVEGRGHLRGLFQNGGVVYALVAFDLADEPFNVEPLSDRIKDGGFSQYSFLEARIRVVRKCSRCFEWDLKPRLDTPADVYGAPWTHREGVGCRKVGHGG